MKPCIDTIDCRPSKQARMTQLILLVTRSRWRQNGLKCTATAQNTHRTVPPPVTLIFLHLQPVFYIPSPLNDNKLTTVCKLLQFPPCFVAYLYKNLSTGSNCRFVLLVICALLWVWEAGYLPHRSVPCFPESYTSSIHSQQTHRLHPSLIPNPLEGRFCKQFSFIHIHPDSSVRPSFPFAARHLAFNNPCEASSCSCARLLLR